MICKAILLYKIIEDIGCGRVGVVYKAESLSTGSVSKQIYAAKNVLRNSWQT